MGKEEVTRLACTVSRSQRAFGRGAIVAACALSVVGWAPPATADEPSAEAIEKARSHYERGVKLFESGDYDAARAELERAYNIAPSYRILYNLGQIQLKKSDYVGALKNFDLYLSEGGSGIPDVRKTQVKSEIDKLRALVASVNVTVNVPGSEVFVDDVSVGTAPLKSPVLVNPGRRKVSATHANKLPASSVVEVVGRDSVNVTLALQDPLRVVAVEKPTRRVPWIGWGVAAGLGVVAGVTGYVAFNASNNLEDERGKLNANPDDLDSYSSRARVFGVVSDVATVGAIVAAGISLYYTIRWGSDYNREVDDWRKKTEPSRSAIQWSPLGASGSF